MMPLDSVLVTGACGRLGHHVVAELRHAYRVTTLDVAASTLDLPHLRLNILDLAGLRDAFIGHDAVVHLAALDGHLEVAPEHFFSVNAVGTWNVLEAAFDADVRRVIIASSSSATGLSHTERGRHPRYLPLDEAHPTRPTHAYGLSKLINELTAESFARRNRMTVACIRPAYIMFPELVPFIAARVQGINTDAASAPTDVSPTLAAALREPLSPLRAYVEPSDLARLFRLALEHEGSGYDLFYGSAADSFEPQPTLAYIERVYGTLPEIRKPSVYERNPHASAIDCSHARDVLGWTPSSDWEQISGMKRRFA